MINSVIMPLILEKHIKPDNQLYREFIFLQKLKIIAPKVKWEEIQSHFDLLLAREIQANGVEYQLEVYDYSYEDHSD